jgi:hypothetical protein
MAARPPAYDKELHFFPGVHRMIWLDASKAPVVAEAWGGEEPALGVVYNVMKPQPTTPGRYVIYSYAPYRTNTWATSKLPWGTKLKLDTVGNRVLYGTGMTSRPWLPIQALIPDATPDVIRNTYFAWYGHSTKYDPDGDGVPDVWVFNDFGPWAVRYFKDKNRNKKLDAGESLSGEMVHTTPQNEGQLVKGESVKLGPSHGCIHVSPFDRDRFHTLGAFDRGVDLIIHPYTETVPDAMK